MHNNKAIPIKAINDYNLKKTESIKPSYNETNYIGTYGTPNTYTADLPESVRNGRTIPDPSQRISYKNPNHSYV